MKSGFLKTLFVGVAAIFAASCSVDDEGYYLNDNAAYGIVANASPNSGDLYFFADANQVGNAPFSYSDARGYLPFFTGDRTLSLKNAAGDLLASTEVTLGVGNFFSAFAVNTFDDIELVVYEDALVKPSGSSAKVRFINLSPDAASIDVERENSIGVVSEIAFKQASTFIDLPAGIYDFHFSLTGSDTPLHTKNVQLNPGRIYTIYTKGFVTPPTGSNDTFSGEVLRNY